MIPKISVIMPAYNSECFIAESIESVLNQNFSDLELLIGDDGSNDNTIEIIKQHSKKDKRIRFFSFPHQGIAKTRNRINGIAEGKYIAPLDSDDLFLPNKLKSQFLFLEKHKDIGVVYGDVVLMDENGKIKKNKYPTSDYNKTWDLIRLVIPHSSCLIRKRYMRIIGGYDESISSALDDDLWLKLGEVTKFHYLREKCAIIRVRHDSVSHTDKKIIMNLLTVRNSAIERRYKKLLKFL